ncbi:MAG: hypothetical protein S4CHLAM102_12870 [Chlamydiia bacterium]|nr:hypothetical protein [Chlamydiia bacterium]
MSVHIFKFIAFIFPLSIFAVIPEIDLQTLTPSEYQIVKKISLHTLYRIEDGFLKVWNPGSRNMINGRNEWFYQFVSEGALDEIAPITALVMDHGVCCGYITAPCQSIDFDTGYFRRGEIPYQPYHQQMLDLFRRMAQKTKKYDVLFNDLSGENFGIIDGKCYYFDLDGIWNLKDYFIAHPNSRGTLFYLEL